MKEFIISEAKVETAVLVGLITQMQDERKTNEYLDELAFLAETAGAEVVKRFTREIADSQFGYLCRKRKTGRDQTIYTDRRGRRT